MSGQARSMYALLTNQGPNKRGRCPDTYAGGRRDAGLGREEYGRGGSAWRRAFAAAACEGGVYEGVHGCPSGNALHIELPEGLSTKMMMLARLARLAADAVADHGTDGGGEGGEILIRESA